MNILSLTKTLRKTSLLILTLGLLCACSGCGRKKIDTGQWYDYGNGLVNLDKVSLLSGKYEILMPDPTGLIYIPKHSGALERTQINKLIEMIEDGMADATDEEKEEMFNVQLKCTINFHPVFTLEVSDKEYNQDSFEDMLDDLEYALEKYEDLVAQLDAISL